MRFLSLFSGIEAASMAWTPLGWEPAAFSEIEPFPCSVLQHHYPHVPNLGDVTKITRQQVEALGRIDLVCGGFPCQDLSAAGKRKGLMNADGSPTRSGLFFDAMRIAEWTRARWTVLENVPGLFSSNGGRDFAAVVGEMAGCEFDVPPGGWENAGVAVGPLGLIEWITLDAQYVRVESHPRAVPQRRRRVFLVRDSGNWANRPPLFLERESLRGPPAPRREARETAPTIPARSTAGGGLGTDFDCDGGLQVAGTMKACKDSGGWSNSADHAAAGYMVPVGTICVATGQAGAEIGAEMAPTLNCNHEAPYVAHSLRGEGFDASEDGTGRGTPLAPMFLHANKGRPAGRQSAHTEMVSVKPIVETLTTDGHAQSAVAVPVAFDTTQVSSAANRSNPQAGGAGHPLVPVGVTIHGTDPTVRKVASYDELAQCLRARTPGNIDNSSTTVVQQPVAYGIRTANTSSNGHGISPELAHTLDRAQGQAIAFPANLSGTQCASTEELAPSMGAANPTAVAIGADCFNGSLTGDIAATMGTRGSSETASGPTLLHAMQVRRLTPVECERLMGFPDGYTAIPWRKKPASECPDGPRYKSLGNSWAVNCARWIGERIEAVEAIVADQVDQAELEIA